jgi:hypothetical protein
MPTVSDYKYEGKGDGPRACAWAASRARGEDTPSEPESSGGNDQEEDEYGEEGKVTPPHSPPCEALPSLGDIFSRQAGIAVSTCQS